MRRKTNRKQLWAVLAASGLAFTLAAPGARANLLTAPGFETAGGAPDASGGDVNTGTSTGANPWQGWNNWVAPYSAYYTAAVAHTGTQAAKTFSAPNAGVYQYVDVTGDDGLTFNASGWLVNSSVDPLQDADQTMDIRVIFNGPNAATIVSSGVVNSSTTQDTWTQLSVTGAIPVGATSAQVMAFFNDPGGQGGSLFVDDMSFTVPEPASLALVGLGGLAMLTRKRRHRAAV